MCGVVSLRHVLIMNHKNIIKNEIREYEKKFNKDIFLLKGNSPIWGKSIRDATYERTITKNHPVANWGNYNLIYERFIWFESILF